MKRLCVGLLAALVGGAINLAAVPAAPSNLTASVNGNTVGLSWTAPAGAILGYRLEAGSAPGLSNLASSILSSSATIFSAPNVPAGTYYARVRALAGDGESAPSNEVVVVVGSSGNCATAPNTPTNLAAMATGTAVNISWAPGGGCPATNYVLQAGSAPGLSNLAIANVGTALGFNATAPPGTYYVRVIAQNAFGSSAPSSSATLTVGGSLMGLTPLTGIVTSLGYRVIPVTMPTSGLYRATLTWSDPAIDLDLYLTTTGCGTSYPPGILCRRAIADASVGNTEQIAYPVLAGQTYYLWVDNFMFRSSAYLVQHSVSVASLSSPGQLPQSADFAIVPFDLHKSKP